MPLVAPEGATSYTFELWAPAGVPMLGSNRRRNARNWGQRAGLIARWRQHAKDHATVAKLPTGLTSVEIWAELRWPDSRDRDEGNWNDTVKPIVDGLVDYGLVPDDDMKHVRGPWVTIGPPLFPGSLNLAGLVTLTIFDLSGVRS